MGAEHCPEVILEDGLAIWRNGERVVDGFVVWGKVLGTGGAVVVLRRVTLSVVE